MRIIGEGEPEHARPVYLLTERAFKEFLVAAVKVGADGAISAEDYADIIIESCKEELAA